MPKTELEKRQNRCCFTGHRPEKLLCSEIQVKNMLAKEITTALRQGKHTFISGMARGSDIYAAELVLEYRAQYPDIHLICALPHPDFEKHWSSEWQQRYRKILMAADYVKVICPVFSMSSYQLRNEWMVNHSSLLIAVYNGRAGGTNTIIRIGRIPDTARMIMTIATSLLHAVLREDCRTPVPSYRRFEPSAMVFWPAGPMDRRTSKNTIGWLPALWHQSISGKMLSKSGTACMQS